MLSSGINSVELSASSSNMLRYISDFCLLNDLYICLPIYKALNLVWCCGYCVQSRKWHVQYNSRSLTDARCALPRLVCSAAVTWINRCWTCWLLMSLSAWCTLWKKCFGNTKTLGNSVLKPVPILDFWGPYAKLGRLGVEWLWMKCICPCFTPSRIALARKRWRNSVSVARYAFNSLF